MPDRWNNPADENNPLRTEERERVRDELEARLTANGVKLTGGTVAHVRAPALTARAAT